MTRGLVIVAALLLGGCGLFGGKDDPSEPPAELVDLRASIPVRKLWSAKVGGGGEDLRLGLSPATDGARVYAASHDGRVSAFDAKSGRRVWSVETKLPLAAGPAYGGGLLALGTSDGDLLALDASNGDERWRQAIGSEVLASPAIGSSVVAVRSVDGRLRGFAADDGAALWAVDQSVPRLTLRGNARPVIAGVTVIAGFDNGRLGAYDITTGEAAWEFALAAAKGRTELDRLVDISGGVKVVGDDVYAVGYQGRLLGVALESGQALWQRELSSYSGLDADWNNIYVTDDAGEVVAVARNSGRPVWRQDGLRRRDITAPTPYQNAVVVGDFEGYLHWLSVDDGSMLARTRVDSSRVGSAPLVVGDVLYAQSDGGALTAFRVVRRTAQR
jgi:outer membrane protein assembly factor BamB